MRKKMISVYTVYLELSSYDCNTIIVSYDINFNLVGPISLDSVKLLLSFFNEVTLD